MKCVPHHHSTPRRGTWRSGNHKARTGTLDEVLARKLSRNRLSGASREPKNGPQMVRRLTGPHFAFGRQDSNL